jgi:flagellar FliJ protein
MAKFNYRLQNILNLMENFEEQTKQAFAERRKILSDEEDKLAALNMKAVELEAESKRLRNGDLDIRHIMENEYEQKYNKEEIKKQKLKVKVAQKNLENARVRMEDAVKERKIHEKLKENAFEEFMSEEAAAEALEVDQLTSYVYGAKKADQD